MYIRKPSYKHGQWCVIIAEGSGPLAKVKQTIKCGTSQQSAYRSYNNLMKEQGRGL